MILTHIRGVQNKDDSLRLLVVHGFIREQYACDFPRVLQDLCVSMFIDAVDEWDWTRSDRELELVQNARICRVIARRKTTNRWRSAFGSLSVRRGEIQVWRLRIVNEATSSKFGLTKQRRSVMIGVVSTSGCIDSTKSYFADPKHAAQGGDGYAYYAYDGNLVCTKSKRREYGLTMTLDLSGTNGVLSFKINDSAQGIAADDVDVTKEYCLATSLFFEEEIEIVDE